ncbi:4-(cytidine 5'-diphospho)-2-C-methyl-D-erythritol kinase [Salinactinospora qingdaonensis]
MTAVTVRVPAKVNLQLAVGPAREDGYHDLVNVFHAVSVFDEVTVTAREPGSAPGEIILRVTGETGSGPTRVPDDTSNLAVRAAAVLAHETGAGTPITIDLHKNIPVAGGMAGGSADAAATLVACDTLWKTGMAQQDLLDLAARLGSDVAFPLLGRTALGTGRGEVLEPLPCGGGLHWVFALAEGGLSTGEVFRAYDRLRPDAPQPQCDPALVAALASGDAAAVGAALDNDLQRAAVSLRPELSHTLAVGEEAGALGTLVSGSGPTCAFLAADERDAQRIAARLLEAGRCARTITAYGDVPGASVVS